MDGNSGIMYLLGILSCALFAVVSANVVPKGDENGLPNLKWPKKFMIEAEKISLTAGWVEDISFWRNSKKSRVDYNNGAVKQINFKSIKKDFGFIFKIHPESTEDEYYKFVCSRQNGSLIDRVSLESILPDVDSFESVGEEDIVEGTFEKFSYNEVEGNSDRRQTLWASYDHSGQFWKPLKYENIEYDTWLNNLKTHEIYNFYNFNIDFDEDVFDVDDYDCHDSDEESDDMHKKARNAVPRYIDPENKDHIDHIFNAFKRNHDRLYADEDEHAMRRSIFERNLRRIIEHNLKNTSYMQTVNKFTDRTPEELARYKGLKRPTLREKDTHPFSYTSKEVKEISEKLPKSFDLRDLGLITPVKDQESCGSCWSFGTTAAVEGALARKNGGRLLRLANQALIDCTWTYGNAGCDGGYDIGAYKWMMKYGLPAEEEYGSYTNEDGFCHIDNMTVFYPIRGYTNVTPFSVDALKVALVNHGPLSVSIDASDNLISYKGGIFYDTDCTTTSLNHEVTLVGYGEHDGDEYWIVKNSWGQSWGIDGYVYLSVRDNNCGITNEPTYVVL